MIAEKIWGTTEDLVVTPLFELHRLLIRPWRRCSLHVHQFKWNAFYVIQGRLLVDVGHDGEHVACHVAGPGDTIIVKPGLDHQFRTQDAGAVALEMYYTQPLGGVGADIIRRNEGGVVKPDVWS